jgi:rubredoxin
MRAILIRPWTYRFDCTRCRSTFEGNQGDVEAANFGGAKEHGGRLGVHYYLTCPECGQENFIPDERLTTRVKEAAEERDYGTPPR